MDCRATVLAVLVCGVVLAGASFPDYIKVCPRIVPDINNCINNSIETLRPKIIEGIPELDVPSIVPMSIDEIKLSRGPKGALFEALLKNVKAWGAESFRITDLKADLDNNIFDFQLLLPHIRFEGNYQLHMNILLFNVFGKGLINGNFTNYLCDARMTGHKVERDGATYLRFGQMKFHLQVGKASIHLSNLFNGDAILGEATNQILNDNSEVILQEIMPSIETALAKIFTDIANRITLKFKYEELFP